jgi:hypothetical protein
MPAVAGHEAGARRLDALEAPVGRLAAALERLATRLEEAARAFQQAGNAPGAVATHQVRMALGDANGREDAATASARALVELAGALGDEEAQAAARFMLGTRLAGAADLAGASACFRAARDAQTALGLGHDAAVSAGMLGQVLCAAGAPSEGLDLLRGARATLRDLGSEAADTLSEILDELEAPASEGTP